MTIKLETNSFFVFDLDDTLFSEIEFVKSAFKEISEYVRNRTGNNIYEDMWNLYCQKENVFEWIHKTFKDKIPDCSLPFLLRIYREHFPNIKLSAETRDFLKQLIKQKTKMGLISDGRSITQRNKLKALGIEHYFTDILISEEFGSEKPHPNNYFFFKDKYINHTFFFIGDNTSKDFIIPFHLGWETICIKDQGSNIHSQRFDTDIIPKYIVSSFNDINLL